MGRGDYVRVAVTYGYKLSDKESNKIEDTISDLPPIDDAYFMIDLGYTDNFNDDYYCGPFFCPVLDEKFIIYEKYIYCGPDRCYMDFGWDTNSIFILEMHPNISDDLKREMKKHLSILEQKLNKDIIEYDDNRICKILHVTCI